MKEKRGEMYCMMLCFYQHFVPTGGLDSGGSHGDVFPQEMSYTAGGRGGGVWQRGSRGNNITDSGIKTSYRSVYVEHCARRGDLSRLICL
jgi:hypothetical protein